LPLKFGSLRVALPFKPLCNKATEMQKGLKHINANYALNSLITDGGLPEMLNNIDKIRKVLKP